MNDIIFLTGPTLAFVALGTFIIGTLAACFGYQLGRNHERDKPK